VVLANLTVDAFTAEQVAGINWQVDRFFRAHDRGDRPQLRAAVDADLDWNANSAF
jgi:hypothetical protein